ncbi:uncharacterized protein isoform X2 [Choristoneura fumiferana]|uniref:uncharacterized protein isoform X2 n=1 Tax=Choristoneura fumiferana TaxID=7141 RepID=UPI003D159D41
MSFKMEFWINLFALFVVSAASSPFISKQYRPDYEYNRKTDAFYKLHTDVAAKWIAVRKCTAEGATLVQVTSEEDTKQIHAMFKKYPDLGSYVLIGTTGGSHESIEDENPMVNLQPEDRSNPYHNEPDNDVMNRNGQIESYHGYRDLPFVCKVEAKSAPYNEECDVYAKDYVSKISTTGSCYRVATIQAKWDEAYANCQSEGAHLAIINNAGELEVVKDMLQSTPGYIEGWQFFVGVRAERTEPRVFKTVLNQTLEEVGYQPWDDNEPNNEFGVEYCVSILRRSGKYNDTVCGNRYSYVCEKERHV